MHLADKVLDHFFRHFEVGNDPVAQRAAGDDVAGGAAEHLFRLITDRADFASYGVERDHAGLAEDDAFVFYVDESVGCAEIDSDVVGEVTKQIRCHDECSAAAFRPRKTIAAQGCCQRGNTCKTAELA